MRPRTQIRSFQAAMVIYVGTIGTAYFPLAATLVPLAGTSSWLVVLATFLITTPWTMMAAWLAKRAPTGNFGLAVETWLGPIVGKLFLFWFAAHWLTLASGIISETSFVFHNIAMPATPVEVMRVALLLLLIYTDINGTETCLRTAQALLLVLIPLLLSFLIAAVASSEWTNLLPIIDTDLLSFAKAGFLTSAYPIGNALFTLFLAVKVQNKNSIASGSVLTIWLAGITLALTVVITIAVLGCCVTKLYVYPAIPLAQSINIGETLVGVDLFVYPMWLISGYVKSALGFCIASSCVKAILPQIPQPWRSLGLGAITLGLAMIPQNLSTTVRLIGLVNVYLAMPFYIAIPLVAIWVKLKRIGTS